MLTPKTQAAIAVLNDIYAGESTTRTNEYGFSDDEISLLLLQLAATGLIKLLDNEASNKVQSYIPTKKSIEVSLLNILEATGEHLDCNHPTTETFDYLYGRAAQKLGVIIHMTRVYLDEIKLSDL